MKQYQLPYRNTGLNSSSFGQKGRCPEELAFETERLLTASTGDRKVLNSSRLGPKAGPKQLALGT